MIKPKDVLLVIVSFAVFSTIFTSYSSIRDSKTDALIKRIVNLEAKLKDYRQKEFVHLSSPLSSLSSLSSKCSRRTELLKDWTNETSWLPRIRNDAKFFRNKPKVTILLWAGAGWTNFRSKGMWKTPNYLGATVFPHDCGLPCEFTTDKSRLPYVDAVLFEVQPLAGYGNDFVKRPPEFPQKRFNQFYVNMGYEQLHYFHLYGHAGYLLHNEITMTFDQTSQVPISMHCNWGGSSGTLQDLMKPPPLKSKLIAWFGTNCQGMGGHSIRTSWVKEFMKHISIDSYGKCHHNADLPPAMQFPIYSNHGVSMLNKVKIFRQYKFGLALENNNVTDYVTEKVFNVLQGGSIPIYMGSSNIDEWVPEGSIIKVSDFASPKALAEHIQRVDQNETLYQQYFAWKSKPFPRHFLDKFDNCVYRGADCRLCQKVTEMKEVMKKERGSLDGPANEDAKETFHSSFALNLSQGKGWVELPNHPIFNLKTNYTLAGWIHPTHIKPMRIIDKGTDGRVDGYSLDLVPVGKPPQLRLRFCGAGKCSLGSLDIPVGSWTWVAVVVVPGKVQLFVNFLIDSEHQLEKYTDLNDLTLCFGKVATGTSYLFQGHLDDISLWERPLTKWELRKLSFTLPRGDERGLIGFWSFNEGDGKVVRDWSEQRLDGIIEGKADWIQSPSKPLILPNAKPMKGNWQVEVEPFLDPDLL